jgi:hypothetical protein
MTARPPKGHPLLPPSYLLLALVAMGALHLLIPVPRVLSFPWTLLGPSVAFTWNRGRNRDVINTRDGRNLQGRQSDYP